MLQRKKNIRRFGILALIVMVGSILLGLLATPAKAAPPPLALEAQSAILIDYATGQVLFEQDADKPIPPASLTKLMTLHLAYKQLAEGNLKREEKVEIRPEAWAATMPDSSVMWLEPGQNVTVGEIMKGIAIPSGNDASVALAQHMAGSVSAFVAMMNKEAQEMGFPEMHFADPAGLSPQNSVTARQFAEFARQYLQLHPESLEELHSVKEYTYPLPENLAPGKTDHPITQENRNSLLWTFDGVDGLKTGFIDESGYNIALTAKQGDMRLVGVILGVPGRTIPEGSANRAAEGTSLLQWGFQNFTTVTPTLPAMPSVRVWKGAANELLLEPAIPVQLTVARDLAGKLTSTVHAESAVTAPVAKGAKLGELIFAADGTEVAKIDLVASAEVKQGGFFKRIWDSIRLTVSGWFNRKK